MEAAGLSTGGQRGYHMLHRTADAMPSGSGSEADPEVHQSPEGEAVAVGGWGTD